MLKSLLTASLAAIGTTLATLPVHALSLSTTFVAGNSSNGAMFDATTFGNSLKVTGLEINQSSISFSGPDQLEVYIKPGTYIGSDTNPAAWTLVSQTLVSAISGAEKS
ncbi:hypothetical protein Syn7502_02075 [Synechococcus sp. PCC 7502]|uniref:hypothetical protein n=1 Tax=Synechococcus sp. PCC 7502 TaxID=1173263 RepID=UPI00029FDC8F|nr:hypothetical protein [Synechococcus sp. PCC 7502]AFY74096.1 hypothetical protein Syn7502_02075 [Synechococcus sp. PCC 7502]